MTDKLAIIISQGRDADPQQRRFESGLAAALAARPEVELTTLPHLYDLAADGPGIRHLQALGGDLLVFSWLYPRAAFWVLDAHGITGRMGRTSFVPEEEGEPAFAHPARPGRIADRTIWCVDLRQADQPEPFVAEVKRILGDGPNSRVSEKGTVPLSAPAVPAAASSQPQHVHETVSPRWYPVIDYARCTNCLECLNFCLFGVFDLGPSDAILVQQPGACRNGCPACSRICPSGAILFPQHRSPGIAGDSAAMAEGLRLDLSQLFGGSRPEELAAAERAQALAEERADCELPPPRQNRRSAEKDDLDRLVDDVDRLEP